MKKVKILFAIMLSTCFVLAGCNGDETTNNQSEISSVSSNASISNSNTNDTSKQLNLNEFEEDFNNADTYNKKYNILKDFYDNVVNNDKINSKFSKETKSSIDKILTSMRKYFKDDFDKQIKVYTFDVTNKNIKFDIKTLTTAKTKLNSILSSIVKDKDIIFTENEIKTYQNNINKLIDSYDKYIKNNDNSSNLESSGNNKSSSSSSKSTNTTSKSTTPKVESSKNETSYENSENHRPSEENSNYQENSKYEESSINANNSNNKPVSSKPASSKPSTSKPSSSKAESSKIESSNQSDEIRWIIDEYKNDVYPNVKASRKYTFTVNGVQRTITIPDCVGNTYELKCMVWYKSDGSVESWNCTDKISGWCWNYAGYYWNSSEYSEWGW